MRLPHRLTTTAFAPKMYSMRFPLVDAFSQSKKKTTMTLTAHKIVSTPHRLVGIFLVCLLLWCSLVQAQGIASIGTHDYQLFQSVQTFSSADSTCQSSFGGRLGT